MTLDEFLDAFREAHKRWAFALTKHGEIRCFGRCPLEVVAHTRANHWLAAARRLRMEARIVLGASDRGVRTAPAKALRERMLAIMAEPANA